MFDTQMVHVLWKEFIEKKMIVKKSRRQKNQEKKYPVGKELTLSLPINTFVICIY